MAKRSNVAGQLSKEQFEAQQNGEGEEEGRWKSASKSELSGRRIIRSARKWKRSSTGDAGAIRTPSSGTVNFSSKSAASDAGSGSNPFAKTSLVPTISTSTPQTSGNPFAKVSFAPAITPVNATIGGNSDARVFATSTKKPKKATTVASVQSDIGASSTISFKPKPKPPLLDEAMKTKSIPMSEKTKLNLTTLRLIQFQQEHNPLSDWTPSMNKFVHDSGSKMVGEINEENEQNEENANTDQGDEDYIPPEKEESGGKENEDESDDNAKETFATSKTAVTTTAPEAPKPLFSFGAQPLTSANASSSGSKPLFSLGSPAAAAAPPKPFTGFSFGTQTNSGAPTPAPAITKDVEVDEGGNAEESKTEAPLEQADENEEKLHECRARYFVRKDGEWVAHKAGTLRIYQDKSSKKCKLVLRDTVLGKVMLNVAIGKGMKFTKKPLAKKKKGMIYFSAMRDREVGMETFALNTILEDLDSLHDKLESLAA